jgi:GDPmannose 4,6-dehydratase
MKPDHLKTGQILVEVLPEYFRPTDVDFLLGDPRKAKQKLGWEAKRTLSELVSDMMASDLELFRRQQLLQNHGHEILKGFGL